ncbi:hypothetical protein BDR05DRAFT_949031 [Suillus weaverae]|nr:hypothetical protein BDR05DRAFT_949031 [Suillus weaverae]
MSTTDAPCRTCPSNATTRPGQIVLNAQVKRCTKAQKHADDLALEEAKELKEAKVEIGLKRLASMQNEMEKEQEETLTKKVVPIQPKPRACKAMKPAVKTSDDHTDSIIEAGEADDLQETVEQMDDGTAGVRKKTVMKKGGKTLIKDAISNMQKKINELSSKGEGDKTDGMARVSDGKDSALLNATTQKFVLGGWITNWKPAVPTEILDADDALIGSFADAINDTLECEAAIVQGKGKSKVASIFEDNLDFEDKSDLKAKATSMQVPSRAHDSDDDSDQYRYSQEPRAPFTQVETLRTLKQKTVDDDTLADDEVSDWSMNIDGPAFEDPVMISDEDSQPEPVVLKKKKTQRTTSLTSVSVASVADSKPPALKKAKIKSSVKRAHNIPAIKCPLNVDTAPDRMRSRGPALDKEVSTYRVIHSLTVQRISEWRSNFGSTGIVIILDFLTRTSDCDSAELAKSLVTDYAFLFENPDKPNPLTVYRSPFVLQLLGTAHLNAINGYVEVPQLDMHGLATCGMSGVISLSAAAIERTLNMFAKKDLKVKEVLAAGSGKLAIKLPKVLNKTTGKMTNAPFLFSGALWTKATKVFIKSLSKKPAGYIEMTIQMGSFDEEESDDERTMLLCPVFLKDLCHFIRFLEQNKC